MEATAFRDGLVVAQVDRRLERLPRVDIPAGWVDFLTLAPTPSAIEPLFTRDPFQIGEVQVLMAMMVVKGIYAEYGVNRLNHGIGFDSAAIELILPTYGEELGLRGRCCRHWALNPHPTLIPAIEAGFVESVHAFGSELGMEAYVAARPDVFFTGRDGSLRSNRALAQTAGHYACDLFIGSTLQLDLAGNSSTATASRITGFGGAPNMGADARGRRHASAAWLKAGREAQHEPSAMPRGRKLVVQLLETFREHMEPAFVERLDAWAPRRDARDGAAAGDDLRRRRQPRGHRGGDRQPAAVPDGGGARRRHPRGRRLHAGRAAHARAPRSRTCATAGAIRRPEDLGIDKRRATRDLLAARTVKDLVRWSGGLYDPPPALPELVREDRCGAPRVRAGVPGAGSPARAAGRGGRGRVGEPGGAGRAAPSCRAAVRVAVATSARGFARDLGGGAAGLRRPPRACAGLSLSVNDAGATPAVVSLRLDQAVEEYLGQAR